MTGFEKLENSLIDVIKEEQAKLGFKEEKIHLYYPLSSLNHFFLAQDSADEMAARLQNLPWLYGNWKHSHRFRRTY